jgi:hypothetical protein
MSTPSEQDVAACIGKVQSTQPTLGALKILAIIKEDHPDWVLSEKRFKKILNSLSSERTTLVARTGIDPSIDVEGIAPKVEVKLFGKGKGKGLVARAKILKGEVLWQEEPWIATADQ